MSIAETLSPARTLDVSALVGTWLNTNGATRGIARFELAEAPGGIDVHVFGAGASETHRWPPTRASVFGDALDATAALAFSAICDLGYADVHLQVNIKGGVLVVVSLNRFKDGSGRSSYFTREFYYRVRG
jgi:hypothetical protein